MGWTKKNDGVVLTPKLINYLNQLSDKLSFDIVVTSGYRTPAKQVDAMFYKIQLGDDLLALYRDDAFAQSVIDAYPDKQKGIEAVEAYVARGGGKTMHLSGNAVDIRTRDLTPAQINELSRVVTEMGDRPLYETTPPHMDISLRQDYEPKKKPILLVGLASALLYLALK